MKTILTVGCAIPGGFGEHIEIFSKASLLDGDFVLFRPTLRPELAYFEEYNGKPLFPKSSSFRVQDAVTHWKKELGDALTAGKTVFLLLGRVEQAYVHTGAKQHSGTGRNRLTTDIVNLVSNYDMLPLSIEFHDSEGTSMALSSNDSLLSEYWREFGDESSYRVHMTGDPNPKPLVKVKSTDRVVASVFRHESGGALVALPWIDLGRDEFLTEETEDPELVEDDGWTGEAKAWGKKYCDALESLDKTIQSHTSATLAPQWTFSDDFRTLKEIALVSELDDVEREIANLQVRQSALEAKIRDAASLKTLLYEQGKPLEHAVLATMRLMGFEANSYQDSDSEFDVVLECPEGRCIGEVEGRDSRAIDINKMRQLEVNIHEDFARDEVSDPAKAILFGNGFRLTPPTERRAEQFTAKCATAAARNGTALVRTSDLYEVARTLIDHPDADFAAACRRAIFETKGAVVTFPALPGQESAS